MVLMSQLYVLERLLFIPPTPTIAYVTQDGECFVMVGGVQPPAKAKADFVPMVIDETVPGECTGIIGVGRPPKSFGFLFLSRSLYGCAGRMSVYLWQNR